MCPAIGPDTHRDACVLNREQMPLGGQVKCVHRHGAGLPTRRRQRYAAYVFQMAVGHSDAIDPEEALGTVLEQCNRALDGATPSAGLLFCNYDSDAAPVLDGIRTAYPDIEVGLLNTETRLPHLRPLA